MSSSKQIFPDDCKFSLYPSHQVHYFARCLSNKILKNILFPGAAHVAKMLQCNLICPQGRRTLCYEDIYHLLRDSGLRVADYSFRRLHNISQNNLRVNHKLNATRCFIENCFGPLKRLECRKP